MNKVYNFVFDALKWTDYSEINHESVRTCEEADKHTPVPEAGLKSILLIGKKTKVYVLCVLAGSSNLDFKKVKQAIGEKISMADILGITERLGCDEGAIPPILSAEFLGQELRVILDKDPALFAQELWYFNPGVNTKTVGVDSNYLRNILEKNGAKVLEIRKF